MTVTGPAAQLVLDLGHRPALGRDDFLVSQCNEAAVAWIDRWPDWPAPGLVVCGPPASGKSHLGQVWRARAGAAAITPADLDAGEPPDLVAGQRAVFIDGADAIAGEPRREHTALHLYNLLANGGGHLLLAARTPPARWPIGLPDLRSRLSALPVAAIDAPDDAVLGAVLLKHFTDRQLVVGADVIQFAVARMERSFEAAERLVAAVDRAALQAQRRVTVPLIREVLASPIARRTATRGSDAQS